MKTISVALKAHLAQSVTTLATCWKVTLDNGTILGFTDFQENLVIGGLTYLALTGFTPSAIVATASLAVDNMNVQGYLNSPTITEADVIAGIWDFAVVEIFLVNYADLTMGTLALTKGTLGAVKTGLVAFESEIRSLGQHLQQQIGRVYGPDCDAQLGDSRCTVNLAAFTVTGVVTNVTSQRVFADSSRTEADGYFDYGKITFTSGLNDGISADVKRYLNAGGSIELYLPMPYPVGADSYTMIAGCDKKFATCKAKFANQDNFQGFPFVPGVDWQTGGTK